MALNLTKTYTVKSNAQADIRKAIAHGEAVAGEFTVTSLSGGFRIVPHDTAAEAARWPAGTTPGLARLRANGHAEKIRQEVLADQERAAADAAAAIAADSAAAMTEALAAGRAAMGDADMAMLNAVIPDEPIVTTAKAEAAPAKPAEFEVDPRRLAQGGDIAKAYSAAAIPENYVKTFSWQGALWTAVSAAHKGAEPLSFEGYKLTPVAAYDGPCTSYAEKTRDAEAARNDPKGFYDGMTVKHRGATYVMQGPPARFVPGAVESAKAAIQRVVQTAIANGAPVIVEKPAAKAKPVQPDALSPEATALLTAVVYSPALRDLAPEAKVGKWIAYKTIHESDRPHGLNTRRVPGFMTTLSRRGLVECRAEKAGQYSACVTAAGVAALAEAGR